MSDLPENVVELLTERQGSDPTALIESFAKLWAEKPQRDNAIRLAKRFYDTYKEALRPELAAAGRAELIALVERYRAEGQETHRIIVDMWLMSRFTPPPIRGVIRIGG